MAGERYTDIAAYHTLRYESTYGTGSGTISDEYPLLQGGDGLVAVKNVTPRRGVSGRGPIGHRVQQAHSRGSILYDFDYDQMSRLLSAILGQEESDAAVSPLTQYDNYFYMSNELPSWAIAVHRGDTKWTYPGCVAVSWTLRYSGDDDILQLEVEWMGRTPLTASTSSQPTYPTWMPVERSHLTVFTVGSYNLSAKVRSFEITGTNPVSERWLAGASGLSKPLINGTREVRMRMDLEWIDEVYKQGSPDTGMLVDWADGTTRAVTMTWNNGDTSTDEREFGLYIPSANIVGNPIQTEAQGVINASIEVVSNDTTISSGALGAIDAGVNATRYNQLINFWLSNAEQATALAS